MVAKLLLALCLLGSIAFADTKNPFIEDNRQHIFPGGIGLPGPLQATCENIIPPPTPATGQIMYCKAGAGWCAKDTGGTERCTGGGGGGSSSFADITSGTNTTAAMHCGAGCTLDSSGGIISASLAQSLANNPTDCAANTFATAIAANGNLTCAQVDLTAGVTGVLPVANGGTNLNAAADDNIMVGNGATWQTKAVPSCSTSSSALTYNTGTNTVSCNTTIAASTATALAADPTDCGANLFATSIDASGNLSCTVVAFNQIAAGTLTGAVGLVVGNGASLSTSGTGTISATTATQLASNPADCGANTLANAINSTGDLTCRSVAATDFGTVANNLVLAGPNGGGPLTPTFRALVDNDIPDTITLTNITQITTRSHSSLQNLLADDHTQYFLLAGRAGGQNASGGTAGTDTLVLRPNTVDTGTLTFNGSDQLVLSTPAPSSGGTLAGLGLDWTSACTQASGCWLLEMFPNNITIGVNGGSGAVDVQRLDPTITIPSGNTGGNLTVHGYAPNIQSGGAATFGIVSGMHFRPNFSSGVTATAFTFSSGTWGLLFGPTFTRTGTGTGTMPEATAVYHQPGFGTGIGDGWTITETRAVHCLQKVGAGTSTITNQGCIDVDALTGAGTLNYSLRSLGTTTEMDHAGPAKFGATGSPTATFKLDVAGTGRFEDTIRGHAVTSNNPGTVVALEYIASWASSSGSNTEQILNLSPTIDMGAANVTAETALRSAGTYNITAKPVFADTFTLIQAASAVNFNVLDGGLLWNHTTYVDSSIITANNVNATSGGGGITVAGSLRSFVGNVTLQATGASGAYHVADFSHFLSQPLIKTNNATGTITVDNFIHYNIIAAALSGAGTETLTTETALNIPALTGTTKIALRNQGATNQIRSAGPATFGADAATTNTSIALEVQSTTQAFMNARMTKAQFDALTLANGMQAYCTDCLLGTSACTTAGGAGTMIWRVNGADRCL